MTVSFPRNLAGLLLAFLLAVQTAIAADPDLETDVQTAWRLLDYIAVDYAGAVQDGEIIDDTEYAEQLEFSATVFSVLDNLPESPERLQLQAEVNDLRAIIADKVSAAEVAELARLIAADLLEVYPVPVAPQQPPDLTRGKQLYEQQCVVCHGIEGRGDGPAAAGLEIPPTDFGDRERARQRSLFALYQTITQGVDGTSMQPFAQLSSGERWALAFYTGGFAYGRVAEGKALWEGDEALREHVPNLKVLADATPADIERMAGASAADLLLAYLRRYPELLAPQAARSPLALAHSRLAESLEAYRAGDARQAVRLALSAYLDGFEPVEPTLATRDSSLLGEVEMAMGVYRTSLQRGADQTTVAAQADAISKLLHRAEIALDSGAGGYVASFVGSAAILLREGLEALLVVIAMMALLRKTGRASTLPWVHAGWILALLAGLVTWFVATRLVEISGASRELTEGIGSLLAAVVLVMVGIWMHGKAHADNWQTYIREKMSKALSGRGAWMLLSLVFVVVYREVFESILFYTAMWAQGDHAAILAGAATAALILAIIAWLMLRYSAKLPITTFFRYSAWLMAIIAVVLAGKGVAAMQEAGFIDVTPVAALPRIVSLGVYPTIQGAVAQLVTLMALLAGFAWHGRPGRTAS